MTRPACGAWLDVLLDLRRLVLPIPAPIPAPMPPTGAVEEPA